MLFKKFKELSQIVHQTNRKLGDLEKKIDEISWANVFNSGISGSEWLKKQSFYPGRWAAGYPMLYILFRIYNDIKPKNVLEFGLGESTKMTYQYHASNINSAFKIIEQDPIWLQFFSKNTFDIRPYTLLLDLEKKPIHGHEVNAYKGLTSALGNEKFDFIIVDGPWGSDHFSRYQIVELFEHNFVADHFIIVIDDYERIGEQETVVKLKELMNQRGIKYVESVYSGIKQTYLICSENYKFIISL